AQEPPPPPGPTPTPTPTPTSASPLVPGPDRQGPPDDKRRTLRSYGHNLAFNFLGVVQHQNHKALLITAGLKPLPWRPRSPTTTRSSPSRSTALRPTSPFHGWRRTNTAAAPKGPPGSAQAP